jgi:BASS family bile acid:Na+ symporter
MMALLFLSFLSIRILDIWHKSRQQFGRIALVLFYKLGLLPVFSYLLFSLVAPQYALAALLLSGISTGVVSPFFADRLAVDTTFVLVLVVLSSILVPFSLPALVGIFFGETMQVSLAEMIKLLCMVVFLPLAAVQLLRKLNPWLIESLLRIRYPVSLGLFAITNLGVFSGYAAFFRQNPVMIVQAFAVAIGLAAIFIIAGIATALRRPPTEIIGNIIIFSIMNNILVIVFSSQFFGALESTVAAVYAIPFFGLILPLRFLQSRFAANTQSGIPGKGPS